MVAQLRVYVVYVLELNQVSVEFTTAGTAMHDEDCEACDHIQSHNFPCARRCDFFLRLKQRLPYEVSTRLISLVLTRESCPMITVGMNYCIIPGRDEQFVAVFEKVLHVMRDMAGHEESHLFCDVFNEHSYLVMSEWSDRDAFDAFIASERFRNVVDWGKENVLAGRPTHEVFESGTGQ